MNTPPVPIGDSSSNSGLGSSGLDSQKRGRSRSPNAPAAALVPMASRSASVPSPSTLSSESAVPNVPLLRGQPHHTSARSQVQPHLQQMNMHQSNQYLQLNHNQSLHIGASPAEVVSAINEVAEEAERRHRTLVDQAITREREAATSEVVSEAERLHTRFVSELLTRAEQDRNVHILEAQTQIENLKREYETHLLSMQQRLDAEMALRIDAESRLTQMANQVQLLSQELRLIKARPAQGSVPVLSSSSCAAVSAPASALQGSPKGHMVENHPFDGTPLVGLQGSQGPKDDVLSRLARSFDDSLYREVSLGVQERVPSERGSAKLAVFQEKSEIRPGPPPNQASSSSAQMPDDTLKQLIGAVSVLQEKIQSLSSPVQKEIKSSSSSASSVKGRESSSSSGSEELIADVIRPNKPVSSHGDPYEAEKQTMRTKHYDKIKITHFPKSAADLRSFRNQLMANVAQFCKGSEVELHAWLKEAEDCSAADLSRSSSFPVLDRVLAAKLIEQAKGSQFALEFQSIQEKALKKGFQPKGRVLLHTVVKRFKLQKDRGTTLTQQHLLGIKLGGSSTSQLEEFKNRVDYVLGALEEDEMPSENALRSFLYEQLKNVPKLQIQIDKFRSASVGSSKRSFQWLYRKLAEVIDEAHHDSNHASITASLAAKASGAAAPVDEKPDKPTKPNKPNKPEKPEKPEKPNPKATPAAPIAPTPKPKPKAKSEAKAPEPKAKAPMSKEEKGKTPCLFFPTGTCFRNNCPYLHDANNPHPNPKTGAKAKAKPASAPKASAACAFLASTLESAEAMTDCAADFAPGSGCSSEAASQVKGSRKGTKVGSIANFFGARVLALMTATLNTPSIPCYPQFVAHGNGTATVSWLGDTGAGRYIGSLSDVQGDPSLSGNISATGNPVLFSTGGGDRPSTDSVRVQGNLVQNDEVYLLEGSPWAMCIGDQVNSKGKAFLWLPDGSGHAKPFFVENPDSLHVHCPDSHRRYADELHQNVPIFKEIVRISHMPAAPDPPEPGLGALDPVSPGAAEGAPGEEAVSVGEDARDKDERLKAIASSVEHQLTHIPKNKFCSTCMRSKQDALPARSLAVEHSLTDDEASKAFGDRVHVDHVIVAKGRLEKHLYGLHGERVCLIADDYTGFMLAYPAPSKSTRESVKALRHFIGRRDAVELYSDNALEFESAAEELKLVHPTTIPYRHTSIINRQIRTLEDVARCALCQAGQVKSLWPLAIQYAATALSLDKPWEALHGKEFPGNKFPFASLVYFRPQAKVTKKVELKTLPGIFVGWRMEPGCGFKKAYKVLSLEQVKDLLSGKVEVYPHTAMTVYQDEVRYPLAELKNKGELALKPNELDLNPEDFPVDEIIEGKVLSLTLPEHAEERKIPKGHFKITEARVLKFGPTLGCSACEGLPVDHSSECRDRFVTLLAEQFHDFPEDVDHFHDSWVLDGEMLIRYHVQQRKHLFTPKRAKGIPVPPENLLGHRETFITYSTSGEKQEVISENWDAEGGTEAMPAKWTGKTVFFLKEPVSAAPAKMQPTTKAETAETLKGQASGGRAKGQVKLPGYGRFYEFCCTPNSNLGIVGESLGLQHVRLTKEHSDMLDTSNVNQLLQQLAESEGVDLWGSLPCLPWTQWNRLNSWRLGPKFRKKILAKQEESKRLLRVYILAARIVLRNKGRVHFEWPQSCSGWQLEELQSFIDEAGLFLAICHGCAFGSPHKKPWRIATSCERLADALNLKRCVHDKSHHHIPVAGSYTANSARYPIPMCAYVMQHLFPDKYYAAVPAMPCRPFVQHEHIEKEVPTPHVFSAIHQLIDRREWIKDPAAVAEAKREAEGLMAEGTWDYKVVIPRNELVMKARSSGEKIHIGQLMTIMSWKHAENAALRKLKARIVFRGDNVRDECGEYAVFQEIRVTPTGISGVNLNLMYGSLKGHHTSQSDVVKAYVQSWLDTVHPTYVELPAELVPEQFAHIHRPCVRLYKSLYGHPESGGHWAKKFQSVAKALGGVESTTHPSSYWFEKERLLLTLYVDDMVVSGPSQNHKSFWDKMRTMLNIEDPVPVSRVLGREHMIHRHASETSVEYDMSDFAESACETYLKLAKGVTLKSAPTPFLVDSALPEEGWEIKGALSDHAAKVLMKCLWLARLSRPDLLRPITELSRRITRWSANDDRKLFRLMCYISSSKHYRMRSYIGDPADELELVLFTDADHGGSIEHGYSASGGLLVVQGPNSWFPISWLSKRQSAVSRSTTEAEAISLATGLFDEGLPNQEFLSKILGRSILLRCKQDNTATIQVIRNGYSPRLRHVSKTHKIDLNGLYDAFREDDTVLEYVRTDSQAADIFTKSLPGPKWLPALGMLGIEPRSPDLCSGNAPG